MTYPEINLQDFKYHLPEEKIPDRPLANRDQSKLLIFNKGQISQTVFNNLNTCLPDKSLLVFNNSKVIPARLFFKTVNGAGIEVLCLQPLSKEIRDLNENTQTWKCIVGNLKRWRGDQKLELLLEGTTLNVLLKKRNGEDNEIEFKWNGTLTFLEILEKTGKIPLPPYMNRTADEEDIVRYQTVYAKSPGSVAAPTAGLHFTEDILKSLKKDGHETSYVTLHVGAGTFKPIKTDSILDHKMHEEIFEVEKTFLTKLLDAEFVIPVGTTSMRTLESLCLLGEKIITGAPSQEIHQWDGFSQKKLLAHESISALLLWMKHNEISKITVKTSIMIVPGYQFRISQGLITNFHQPESTLILLVAAFLGEKWKKVYDYALQNGFRFLSYGDSSILLP